eukprot:TRINITY_DN39479_c0_g1_i1.p4 TRINITY_DN39479_c0_g1~~TRINITY_DN39479_c0_g1_i1.p4  ORF type:complete len:112 (+),score=51.53 TRINITY_DN39479_c0_g1_i1:80-415(+)
MRTFLPSVLCFFLAALVSSAAEESAPTMPKLDADGMPIAQEGRALKWEEEEEDEYHLVQDEEYNDDEDVEYAEGDEDDDKEDDEENDDEDDEYDVEAEDERRLASETVAMV